jgi:hypothetical protein
MDTAMIDAHLENIDRRLTKLEQILPTLATKHDLTAFATKDDLKALATTDDLEALATKDELRAFATKEDLRAEHERSRLGMKMLLEHQDSKLELLAEHVLSLTSKRTEE